MERTTSTQTFHKKQMIEKINKLQEDINTIKEMMCEIQSYIIKINNKTPIRKAGWFGDYKTYEQ